MNQTLWTRGRGVRFALLLSLFQGGMPLIGWGLAAEFSKSIEAYDHWIAFALLLFLGGRMIWQSLRGGSDMKQCDHFKLGNGMLMGLATSVDALIAGVAMALLHLDFIDAPQFCNMLFASGVILAVTLIFSMTGLFIGRRSRSKLGQKAELVGGMILILIGVKVLLEHLCA